jgi:hypothetical protein
MSSGMGMVERVADAILAIVPVGYGMTKPEARDYARAAIEALREPTDRMVWTANRLNHPRDRDVWITMCDAALQDGENP